MGLIKKNYINKKHHLKKAWRTLFLIWVFVGGGRLQQTPKINLNICILQENPERHLEVNREDYWRGGPGY